MAAKNDPGFALAKRMVAILRADPTMTTLLFSPLSPQHVDDSRIFVEDAHLPPPLREILPRVLVGINQLPFDVEQDDYATPQADVTVFVYVLVEAEQRDLGEQIMAQVRVVLGSTPLSDSTIIAAGLVPLGVRAPVREAAFRDAWRLTRLYRAPHIGVLP